MGVFRVKDESSTDSFFNINPLPLDTEMSTTSPTTAMSPTTLSSTPSQLSPTLPALGQSPPHQPRVATLGLMSSSSPPGQVSLLTQPSPSPTQKDTDSDIFLNTMVTVAQYEHMGCPSLISSSGHQDGQLPPYTQPLRTTTTADAQMNPQRRLSQQLQPIHHREQSSCTPTASSSSRSLSPLSFITTTPISTGDFDDSDLDAVMETLNNYTITPPVYPRSQAPPLPVPVLDSVEQDLFMDSGSGLLDMDQNTSRSNSCSLVSMPPFQQQQTREEKIISPVNVLNKKTLPQQRSHENTLSWSQRPVHEWEPEEVLNWVYAVAEKHSIDRYVSGEKFQDVDGYRLCHMTDFTDFLDLSETHAHCFYDELKHLKAALDNTHQLCASSVNTTTISSIPASSSSLTQIPTCVAQTAANVTQSHPSVAQTCDSTMGMHSKQPRKRGRPKKIVLPTQVNQPPKIPKPRGRKPGQRSKGHHLWEFIRDLLLNPRYCPSVIRWEDRPNGIFRIVDSKEVSMLWGIQKKNKQMTYEKLSRAIRFCQKESVGYFAKLSDANMSHPKKLCFRFGPKTFGWQQNFVNSPPIPTSCTSQSLSDQLIQESQHDLLWH